MRKSYIEDKIFYERQAFEISYNTDIVPSFCIHSFPSIALMEFVTGKSFGKKRSPCKEVAFQINAVRWKQSAISLKRPCLFVRVHAANGRHRLKRREPDSSRNRVRIDGPLCTLREHEDAWSQFIVTSRFTLAEAWAVWEHYRSKRNVKAQLRSTSIS